MLLIRQSLRWAVGNDYPSGLVDFEMNMIQSA